LEGYLDWPGARPVGKGERAVACKGQRRSEVRYAVTGLGAAVSAARLLELVRGRWAIAHRLHGVREVTLGEDRCRVRTGAAPQVLAALPTVVLGVLRRGGATHSAAPLRQNGWQPDAALRLLGAVIE
jgi:hypothetical protein